MSEGRGVATAVAIAVDLAGEDEPEFDLGLPATAALEALRRQPGRPKGARNRRTLRVAELLLLHGDPLRKLIELGMTPVDQFAASLGCSALEAAIEQRQCLAAALPYIHQKQPLAVNLNNRTVVHLTINEGAPAGGETFTARVLDNEEFQRVTSEGNADVGQSAVGQEDQAVEDAG